jgi:hypothetical protein
MLKTVVTVVTAAVVAAVISMISAPIWNLIASPLPEPAVEAIATCKQRPWPYLNCVGTAFVNPDVV